MQATGREGLEGDRFIRYPVMLEQCLMEGAYDQVWRAMKGEGVPSEEFAVFSEVRNHSTIFFLQALTPQPTTLPPYA